MLSVRDQELVNRVIALATSGGINPGDAIKALADINEAAVTLRDRLNRPQATDRIYTVPFVGFVTVASTGITGIPQTVLPWAKNGRILGIKATVREGNSLISHVTINVKDERQYSFFTNGTGDGFISLAMLQGNVFDQGGWSPIFGGQKIKASTQWYVTASSGDSLPASGSTNYTPEVCFLVDESDEAAKAANNAY